MTWRYVSAALLLVSAGSASAQSVTPYDYYKSAEWLMSQQFIGSYFDACVAQKDKRDGDQRLTIGRSISGDDFMLVHGVQNQIGSGETEAAGQVIINNEAFDFSKQVVSDSVSEPGSKYISIYLASGFVDRLAKANSMEIAYSQGRTKFGLKGSKDVIGRLNECMDNALNREMDAVPIAPAAPEKWIAGVSAEGSGGRYIAVQIPHVIGTPGTAGAWMAYAENGQGRFDIRLRDQDTTLSTKIDLPGSNAQRFPVTVMMNGALAFSALATAGQAGLDIIDIPPEDLLKLGNIGAMVIKSLDGKGRPDLIITLMPETQAGPAAITSASSTPAGTPTLETLVGTYWVRGRNPNGDYYYGTAVTKLEGNALRIDWTWQNQKTDTAQASLFTNVVTAIVAGLNAPAIYNIGKDGVWRGTWDNGRASEYMVPKR